MESAKPQLLEQLRGKADQAHTEAHTSTSQTQTAVT